MPVVAEIIVSLSVFDSPSLDLSLSMASLDLLGLSLKMTLFVGHAARDLLDQTSMIVSILEMRAFQIPVRPVSWGHMI